MVVNHLKEVNTEAYADFWAAVASWCIMASQGNTAGESLLSFSIKAITEMEDKYLRKWLEQRLNMTTGPHPQGGGTSSRGIEGGGAAESMTQAAFAADIGKGGAHRPKALGGPMAAGQLQGPTKEGNEKTCYTDNNIAAIMGFLHVH